jgi:hypothetical protein
MADTVKLNNGAWTDPGTGAVPLTDVSQTVEAPVDNKSTGAVPLTDVSGPYTSGIPFTDDNSQTVEETKSVEATDDVVTTADKPAKRTAKKGG